jgi:hypothetical protein
MIRFIWRRYYNHTRLWHFTHSTLSGSRIPHCVALLSSRKHADSLPTHCPSVRINLSPSLVWVWVWVWVVCYYRRSAGRQSWNKAPIWGLRSDLDYCQTVAGLLLWGVLSDERTGVSFAIATGPRQRSHFRVRVPWDSRPYFTVSDSRLPFSLPPTTRRATVEVFASGSAAESESYVTTDGQPASVSWNKAPLCGLRPDLYYCLTVAGLLIWGALSDERTVCRLQFLLALASAVIFWSESHRTSGHILLSQIRDFPFRRLVRLAGSRWRYSTPPPHGFSQPLDKVKVTLRLTVSQSVSLGVEPHLRPMASY